jgi:hypothetical protein
MHHFEYISGTPACNSQVDWHACLYFTLHMVKQLFPGIGYNYSKHRISADQLVVKCTVPKTYMTAIDEDG